MSSDEPPPEPRPRHVARYVLLLIALGIATPFLVNANKMRQLRANETAVVALLKSFIEAQKLQFQRTDAYAQTFADLGGDWAAFADMDSSVPTEYRGYRFRILKGESGASGSVSYLDKHGRMTKGFALLAAPVKYGYTGKDIFLVAAKDIYAIDMDAHSGDFARNLHHLSLPPGAVKVE